MRAAFAQSFIIAAGLALSSVGCHKELTAAPSSVPVEQLSPVVGQTFTNADEATRAEATQYATAVQNQNWSDAFTDLQQLRAHPNLTMEQRAALAGVWRTTSEQLNELAERGDQRAAEVLRQYKATR